MPPTYATQADFEAYAIGWTTTDAVELNKILMAAERDVDRVLGYQAPAREATGLRLDPTDLSTGWATALKRAVCAQAEYRIEKGPEFFRSAQYASVGGPKFSTTGVLPDIGPNVYRELAAAPGLVSAWGEARG
jgi:hypothetical protein